MADENKPAFYPRVGNIKAKNFRSAQPAPFIDDPRAMDLPQFGDIDLSQPTKANLEMGRRMAERDAQLKRQQSADTSPLEKAAGALQAVRLMGSALTQSINSLPTRIAKGDEAADKFMQERMYKPEQPLAYEYAGDLGNMLERLETEYKIPPVLPEAVALQYLAGPATSQATRGALQAGAKLERSLDPMVTQALERGGLQRDLLLGLGQGTASNLDVWHGSPHKFPPTAKNPLGEFNATKIGTGEGAQSYGHGHYTSEAKEVGKGYQPRSPEYEEKLIKLYKKAQSSNNYPMMEVLEDAMLHSDPEDILKKFTNPEFEYTSDHAKAAQDFAKWYAKNPPEVGSLYRVDLADAIIPKMLDWNAKFENQHPDVQSAILKYWADNPSMRHYGDPTKMTGEGIYGSAKAASLGPEGESKVNLNPSNEAASMDLRHYGIPGIKYLDESHRTSSNIPSGVTNFVVFPGEENALTILERKKEGGGVAISNNPDTMMLELGNKRMKEGGSEDDAKPYFGGAGTKKYAAAKKRAEQADVNLLKDPKTYAAVASFLGEAPDEMGFSVMHPDYQGVREVADPAFYAGTALGVAPLMKVFKAPTMALGRAGEKYAEKVVPKIMERGGLGAEILGGLAQGTRSNVYLPHTEKKPNPLVGSRYKTQHVGNLTPKYDFDIQAEQGSSVMSNPWDLTSRGEKVLEVSDIPLSNQIITEGGHDFARDLANIQANIGGASGRQIAERMQDRVNDAHFANLFDKGTGRVFTMPSTMDVKGSHFSTMPTDIVMDIFQQANLKPKDVERVTDDLRTFVFEGERNKFKNAAPVGSPEFLLQLRQGGKGFSAGDLRKGLMDRMSKSEYQQMLGYNIEDVYGAIGDQALKGLPKGFVGNTMIETSPFADVVPATHQSYDTANLGKYAGSMPSMPLELMMPDLFRAIEINYLKDPKYRKLTPMQLRTMIVNTIEKRGNVISQPINQRVVDNVMRYKEGLKQGHFKPNDYDSIMEFMRRTGGYKDGGTVKKAEGGDITGDDLIIEERPL